MVPTERTSELQNSGHQQVGENGDPANPKSPNQRQYVPTIAKNTFPKVSSNFDKPSSTINHLTVPSQKIIAPTVRLNAPVNNNVSKPHCPTQDSSKINAPTPHAIKPTFASTLRAMNEQNVPRIDISPAKQTTKQGYPAVIFKREDFMVKLAERCKFTLIGKFESTMPRMEVIRRSFEAQVQLKSNAKIAHFNSTHVYIDLDNQLDHDTVWFKQTMWIQGRQMKLFKWTPTFKPAEETPIAPIWVVLPELPWHMYYLEAMCELFKSIGRVISLDVATFQKTRGSVAKAKLEIDVTNPMPKYFWVGYDEDENGDGYWQEAQYEEVPAYCSYCKHQGHLINVCSTKKRHEVMASAGMHKTVNQLTKMQERPTKIDTNESGTQNQNKGPLLTSQDTQQQGVVHYTQHSNSQDINQAQKEKSKAQPKRNNSGKPPVSKLQFVAKTSSITAAQNHVNTVGPNNHAVIEYEAVKVVPTTITTDGFNSVALNQIGEFNAADVMTDKGGVKGNHVVVPFGKGIQNKSDELQCQNVFPVFAEEEIVTVVPDGLCGLSENHKSSESQAMEITTDAFVLAEKQLQTTLTDAKKVTDKITTDEKLLHLQADGIFNTKAGVSHQRVVHLSDIVNENAVVAANNYSSQSPAGLEIINNPKKVKIAEIVQEKENSVPLSTKDWVLKSFPPASKEDIDTSAKISINAVDCTSNKEINAMAVVDQVTANHGINGLAEIDTGAKAKKTSLGEVENAETVCHNSPAVQANYSAPTAATKPSTEYSFGKAPVCHSATADQGDNHTSAPAGKLAKNTSTTGKKARKNHGKNEDASVVKAHTVEVTQNEQHQTEEEIRKAKIRAWQDAILAKSYAENPIMEGKKEDLNVLENKATYSVPSQDSFDPTNAITLGRDNDDIENDRALTAYVSPAHSGNTLIPTATLEVMCKQASKVMKEVGRGFFPVTPQARIDTEAQEAPTYYLGDLFEDSQKDQNEPSKRKWNLDAPLFIPNALRHQITQVPVESVDSQDASALQFPTGPSDEVLLQRMDLHDIRGLLHRQNSPPHELPQKFSSPHPGIIEDGSEYEDEDEDSTAYNKMAEARYAGLSPRFEQACKPKLIKKKRRPLEPKKKEAAPKKPKRVQPTRSSKSRSSRRK